MDEKEKNESAYWYRLGKGIPSSLWLCYISSTIHLVHAAWSWGAVTRCDKWLGDGSSKYIHVFWPFFSSQYENPFVFLCVEKFDPAFLCPDSPVETCSQTNFRPVLNKCFVKCFMLALVCWIRIFSNFRSLPLPLLAYRTRDNDGTRKRQVEIRTGRQRTKRN